MAYVLFTGCQVQEDLGREVQDKRTYFFLLELDP